MSAAPLPRIEVSDRAGAIFANASARFETVRADRPEWAVGAIVRVVEDTGRAFARFVDRGEWVIREKAPDRRRAGRVRLVLQRLAEVYPRAPRPR